MTTYYITDDQGRITTWGPHNWLAGTPEEFSVLTTEEEIVYGPNENGAFYGYIKGTEPPIPEERLYEQERAAVDDKYSAPWNGRTGGTLILLQMAIVAALASGQRTTDLFVQYNTELSAMQAEFQAIDEKYGVA